MQKAGGRVTRDFKHRYSTRRQSSPEALQAPVSTSAESEDPEVGSETRPAKAQLGQQDNFLSDELVPKYYTSSQSTGLL